MIKFHFNLAPNPTNVAQCLEEMGLKYEIVPVDTRKGEQHTPESWRSIPTPGAGDQRRRRHRLRQQRNPDLSRREDLSVPAWHVAQGNGSAEFNDRIHVRSGDTRIAATQSYKEKLRQA